MNRLSVALVLVLFGAALSAQHNTNRDVLVKVKKSVRDQEVYLTYEANNVTSGTQTIVLNIDGRPFEKSDASIPVVRKLNPGTNRLVQLSNISSYPQYNYMYISGCVDTEPDDLVYLLPIAEGAVTRMDTLKNISELYFGEEPEAGALGFSFTAEPGQTIHAARRGTVIKVVENVPLPTGSGLSYSQKNNYVIIEHEDCTKGRYELFAEDGVTTAPGLEVEAGDPLGRVADGKAYLNGTHFRFSVSYPNLTRKDLINKMKDRAKTFKSKFIETRFANVKATDDLTQLEGSHPEEVIFQEMSKREIKRYKKGRE